MPIYMNGKKIKDLHYAGKKIKEAWYNGRKVYTSFNVPLFVSGATYNKGDMVYVDLGGSTVYVFRCNVDGIRASGIDLPEISGGQGRNNYAWEYIGEHPRP